MNTSLTVIILTYNEHLHLERCIGSVLPIASNILVIDSFSTDDTLAIAERLGARTYQNPFINQAVQFQWALDNCPIDTEWVMRMDADEYVTPELRVEINQSMHTLPENITGIILKRQVHFMGKWIKYGGYYPTKLLRIWRNKTGRIEQRWMDEHIVLLHGDAVEFQNDIVDDNLNNLIWWTNKHNNYSTREAVDLLNKKYSLFNTSNNLLAGVKQEQATRKRWYKDNFYLKMPLFLRAFLYFLFRYFLKFGFLDGKKGLIWHFLQGFWYRFLTDAKIFQIEYLAKQKNKTIIEIIEQEFAVKITHKSN